MAAAIGCETYDFIIVGSGAGSVIAALAVKDAGARALIIEKAEVFGGSTALSGGIVWVPNNPVSLRAGVPDNSDAARLYLDGCAGAPTRSSSRARRDAFLDSGPQAIEFLELHGMKFNHSEGWSDYHEGEVDGAMARGRAIEACVFDVLELGPWAKKLRRNHGVFDVPFAVRDVNMLALGGKTWPSRLAYVLAAWRLLKRKLGRHVVAMGASLQGRLLQIALKNDIPIWLDTPVENLIEENGRVVGVQVLRNGNSIRVNASGGVLVDAGGFAHNQSMRQQYSRQPAQGQWTLSNPGDTGEMLQKMMSLGASTDVMDEAWWTPGTVLPDGVIHTSNPMDMAKPHCLLVDSTGERYANEAASYVALGIAMFERNKLVPAVPSWFVMDWQNREKYRMGLVPPGRPPQEWLDSGFMQCADSLEELALKCGMDPRRFGSAIDRFNQFACSGDDLDFGKGKSAYHRFWGDPTHQPNPCLGTIEKPPFYAIKIIPADVGTAGGVVTDELARVLREDGSVIGGLYATGNCTAPVVGRSYPGPGASIGASMVFGYIAARHAVPSSH